MHTPLSENEAEVTKAVARLPGLDIEVRHRQSPDGLAEEISINLKATPSFEAFGRSVEALNPFALWSAALQLAWLPLDAGRSRHVGPELRYVQRA